MIAAIFKADLRHWLILLNIFALIVLAAYVIRAVLSPKRAASEEKSPANLTPFLPDEDLEGRRLERVQGWALIFAAVVAVALPLYWLREPTRQTQSITYFDKNSVARGAVLFANPASPDYNAAVSLQCANCHGQKGIGGAAPTSINGVKVVWKAPPLNTEALRFEEDQACLDPAARLRASPPPVCDLTDIVTFGRPGTPMQGWGVAGGGPKNEQSIADLVAYIESIQLTPAQAQAQAAAAVAEAKKTNVDPAKDSCPEYMSCPALAVAQAKVALDAANKALDTARSDALKALTQPATNDESLKATCTTLTNDIYKDPKNLSDSRRDQGIKCNTFLLAKTAADTAQANYNWTLTWQKDRAAVTSGAQDGQLLFELNCARCHTAGWSTFDPTLPPAGPGTVADLGLPGGGGGLGGGIGFNLRDEGPQHRFGEDVDGGWDAQVVFVSLGSQPNKQYGNTGLGTGKMPGFGQTPTHDAPFIGAMLTEDQIKQIVSYERYCLDTVTSWTVPQPLCVTPTKPETAATTTTLKKG